jgi:adenosine deaminase
MISYQSLKQFPKAELHCHLDGSIRPETLQAIAQKQQLPISSDTEVVRQKMQAPKNCHNLEEYLHCFDFVLPYLQTNEALQMAAFDVMEQAALDGVRYIEIRFAPSLSIQQGLTVAETIQAVAQGIALAETQYSIYGTVLIIGMRQEDSTAIAQVFRESLAIQEPKVVGLDLAGPEEDGYLEQMGEELLVQIEDKTIPFTLHAGECGCVANIYQAIAFGTKRIGHGIALKGDDEAQRVCADRAICIEGCPTSNIQTKAIMDYQDYPIREWLKQGMIVCLNTDNRTVSHTTLTNEYWQIYQAHHLTWSEVIQMNQNAMHYSFAPREVKEKILKEMASMEYEK